MKNRQSNKEVFFLLEFVNTFASEAATLSR